MRWYWLLRFHNPCKTFNHIYIFIIFSGSGFIRHDKVLLYIAGRKRKYTENNGLLRTLKTVNLFTSNVQSERPKIDSTHCRILV